jgi:hypothetical protein
MLHLTSTIARFITSPLTNKVMVLIMARLQDCDKYYVVDCIRLCLVEAHFSLLNHSDYFVCHLKLYPSKCSLVKMFASCS